MISNQSRPESRTYKDNHIGGNERVQLGDINYNITNYGPLNVPNETDTAASPTSRWRQLNYRSSGPELTESKGVYEVPKASNYQFTGRKTQLDQIKRRFSLPNPSELVDRNKVVVLVGLGGSGKSQVSLRYAELNRNAYWGVFWIDASTRASAVAAYTSLSTKAGTGPTWTAGKQWLSDRSRPWLLVLDNVSSNLQRDIPDFFPLGNKGHILITTRIHDVSIYATVGHLEFGKMDPEEATELLLRSAYADARANNDDTQRKFAARGIAETLGYLAIALNLAGSTIRKNKYTFEMYVHYYLGNRHRLLASRNRISQDEIEVITTWEIPFQQIEQQSSQDCQDAVVLMCVFAFLHSESISRALLEDVWTQETKQSPWVSQLPDLFKSGSKDRLRRAISLLADRSILEVDAETWTCSLHPVVHDWAMSRMDSNDKLTFWLQRTLLLLSCCDAETFTAAKGMSILPHLDFSLEVAREYAPEILQTMQGMYEMEIFASMYAANGDWQRSLELLEEVTRFRLKTQGRWHEDTLRTQRSLAQNHWNLFQLEKTLQVQEEIRRTRWYLRSSPLDYLQPLRPSHLPYLIALDDLTQSLWLANVRKLSRMTGQRAVKGLQDQLGMDDPRTWNAMFNLGRTYVSTGEIEKGHELLLFVVRTRKKRFGVRHVDTLMARNELGMCYLAQKKRLSLAHKLVSNVYEDRIIVLGRDHPYTLWSANDLSRVLCEQKRFSEALDLLNETLPLIERTVGSDHVGMQVTKGNLARAYALSKNWKQADTVMSELLPSMPSSHPDWLQFAYGGVRVKAEVGKLQDAEVLCQSMIKSLERPEYWYFNLRHPMELLANTVESVKGREEASEFRFRTVVELMAFVYLKGGQKEKLDALWEQHPWMNQEHIENPPSVLELSRNV